MKWCCETFHNRYDAGGRPGLSVIVDRGFDDQPRFYLQGRAIPAGVDVRIDASADVQTVSEFVVDFCPWCGATLRKFYRKTAEELIRPGLKIPIE
jgi:hypothetical protein